MNSPEDRIKEKPNFRNISSEIYSNLDNNVISKTVPIASDRDQFDQKLGVVQNHYEKFDNVFEISQSDETNQKQKAEQNDSVHFDETSVSLEGNIICQKQREVQKDGVKFDSVSSEVAKWDTTQRLLQINDKVPIAQMLQKEKNVSDKLLIKDIWSQKKMVYYNHVFTTDTSTSSYDKENTSGSGSDTHKRLHKVRKQDQSQKTTVTTNTQKISSKFTNSFQDDMRAVTGDIGQKTCQDKMTIKTDLYSDNIQSGSSSRSEDCKSGKSSVKESRDDNFSVSLNTKCLHITDTFPDKISRTTPNMSSTARQRLDEGHKVCNTETKMIGSDGNHIGYYDNRAEENHNQSDLSTDRVNDMEMKLIGYNMGNHGNRSGKNHSDWSADGHMMMHCHSNLRLSARTKTHRRTKCCSSRRCQMENKMEEYARTSGFIMVDVPNDGNCMFASVVDQLRTCGVLVYTTRSLRAAAVKYLKENPHQEDGTHTEMFLHHETWEEYLYRMDQDAEWGDHIILNTIAKILNRCISVVNVSLTNQSKTLIQPSVANLDQSDFKRTLFLGHFGEEHFVSLRPRDWEDTWYIYGNRENEQTSIQQQVSCSTVVTVDNIPSYIKEPSSFDDISDTSLPHFSFLLKYLLKSKHLLPKQSKSRLTAPFSYCNASGEFAGSRVDGLNFSLTDISTYREISSQDYIPCCKCHRNCHEGGVSYDLMVHMDNNVMVVCNSAEVDVSKKCLISDSRDLPPGYTKLRVLNPEHWDIKQIYWSDDNIPYLKHIQVDFDSNFLHVNPDIISKRLKKGIKYPSWPNEADEWITRKRPSNWPSTHLVSKIVNNGCIVVSRSHPHCEYPDIVWQFLFSGGEHILIKEGVTQEQIRCFSIFKVLFDCHVRNLPGQFSTSLLKHVWFYCCEIIPSSYWSDSQGACLLFLFDRLLENLRHHNLPNFFIRENNMINQYPREIIQRLGDKVEAIRKFPILSLIFVCGRHGLLDDSDFEDVLDDVEVYKSTRNLYFSVTKVFIPLLIDLVKPHLCCHCDDSLVHNLQDAFEMVLSTTSTHGCVAVPNFQDFVLSILKPDTNDFDLLLQRSFIALNIDQHLHTSIMPNLMTAPDCITLKHILGEENKGMYGELLVPKSEHDNMKIIIKLATILYELKYYEQAAFYLRYGIRQIKEEKAVLMVDDTTVTTSDQADKVSRYNAQTGTNLSTKEFNKTLSKLKMMDTEVCNSKFTILFYTLYYCYIYMNQIELIQEFVEDFEAVAMEISSVPGLQLLSKIYTSLGSDEKKNAINQKITSLGGSIPKCQIVTATIVA